jgi:hypothetical protein
MENEDTSFTAAFSKPLTIAKIRFLRNFEKETQDIDVMLSDRESLQLWIGEAALRATVEDKKFHELFIKWLEDFWMEYMDVAKKEKEKRNGERTKAFDTGVSQEAGAS